MIFGDDNTGIPTSLTLRLWGNRNSYDRIYSKAKVEGLVYPVPTINPPHYHTRMKKQIRFRTTIKLHDFIAVNPVQNNRTINSKCFKINFTSTAASNEIVYASSFSVVYIPELGYATYLHRYRCMYVDGFPLFLMVSASPRFLCRLTALIKLLVAVQRQSVLYTENSGFVLQLWVSTFPRFVAIGFDFLS